MISSQTKYSKYLWAVLLLLVFFFVDLMLPLGIASGVPYVIIVLVAMWFTSTNFILGVGVVSTLMTILGYYFSHPNSELWNVFMNRYLAFAIIWGVVIFAIWHNRRSAVAFRKEGLYGILFESSVKTVFIVDKDGKIVEANNASLKLFGYTREELVGLNVTVLMPTRHIVGHKEFAERYAKGGASRRMAELQELYAKGKDGREFPVEISLSKFQSDDEVLAMVIVSDISERKKVEKALIKSEHKYRTLYETIVQGVVVQDRKYDIISANRAFHEILGAKPGQLEGLNHFNPRWKLVHADGTEFLPEDYPINEAFRTGESIMNIIAGIYHSNNTKLVWVNINTFPQFKDGESEPYQVVSTFEDITPAKEAKDKLEKLNVELEKRVEERSKALKDSQEMYKMIARNFPNGVINVLDRDLNYIFAEGMEMYRLGITSEVLIGTSFISRISLDIREEVEQQLLSVFEGNDVSFELNTDGRTYIIYAVAMKGEQDEVNQVLMVSQNVTGMKKAEQQTKRALEKERHLNELKSRFVSMASHEFRTPLTSAMNSLTLLSKYIFVEGSEDKQERHVHRINSAILHLTNILNDFLSIDKLEEGKVAIHISEIDLPMFIEEAIEDMGGMQKTDQIINYNHEGLQLLSTDKMMLKTILNNLLSNAIKYSPNGSIVTLDTSLDKDWFTIVVKDEGVGIPEEEQHQLFERFFRAKNVTEIQGTGLGLNIVKKYVEMVDGEISFVSENGEGTTFTIRIPNNFE